METKRIEHTRNLPTKAASFLLLIVCGVSLTLAHTAAAQSAGALANGQSAAAVSRGGIMAAENGDPLDAIEGNPAGLAGIHARLLDIGGIGLIASGSFRNSVDSHGRLHGAAGALPYGAFALPLGKSSWTAAVAVTPDALMRVDWRYLDPPGTAGASYGLSDNRSEIVALRSSVALARTFGPKWAGGATVGLVYNTNSLNAPYIFQQQPQLKGLKVRLDLNTRGFGWNGSAGLQGQLTDRVRIGAAWKSGTFVQSHGDASGSASAQFAALGIVADPAFHYRAEVDNHLPQNAALGTSIQISRRTRIGLETDWTNWRDSFKQLPVKLKEGTNATIDSVVGSDSLFDAVPLDWRDQYTVRTGIETLLRRGWAARAGYAWMSNPIPSKTLMPLTGAILQNTLSAGAGWSREHVQWDAAYQAQLPASASVEKSALQASEYNNSHLSVMAQSVTVSARFQF